MATTLWTQYNTRQKHKIQIGEAIKSVAVFITHELHTN